MFDDPPSWVELLENLLAIGAGNRLEMNWQKLLCVPLMCFGFSLVYAAAQAQPAASPPASAPASPLPSTKSGPATATPPPIVATPLADPQTPVEFFARARQLSDLEAAGIPFHLKATYVATGDAEFTGNGTYEEWWQSKDLWRIEATLGEFRYVAIRNGGPEPQIYTNSVYVPWQLRQVLDDILIRIPTDAGTAGKWKIRHKKIKKVDLVVLSEKDPCATGASSGSSRKHVSTQECMSQAYFASEGVLRIQMSDFATTVYNGFQAFQNLLIPRAILVADGGSAKGFPITITLLESLNPSEKESSLLAAVPAGLQPFVDTLGLPLEKIGGGVTPPIPIRQVLATFPQSVRQTHQSLQKSVVIEVIVDEIGNVREPHVVQSAGPDLDDAALTAVSQYKFKPAKYKGHSVPGKMDVLVAFHIYR